MVPVYVYRRIEEPVTRLACLIRNSPPALSLTGDSGIPQCCLGGRRSDSRYDLGRCRVEGLHALFRSWLKETKKQVLGVHITSLFVTQSCLHFYPSHLGTQQRLRSPPKSGIWSVHPLSCFFHASENLNCESDHLFDRHQLMLPSNIL